MEIKVDLAPIGDKYAATDARQALLLQLAKFGKEAGDVEDDSGAYEIHAIRVDEAGRKQMEAV